MTKKKKLLWSDDEGPGRFLYAAYRLEADGWAITWANSVEEAANFLREEAYDAILLDQMMPLDIGGDRASVWSGCTLLRWLKGLSAAPAAPPNVKPPEGVPLKHNTIVPMAILSAYRHDDVEAATREAMREEDDIPHLSKPLDLERVRALLRRA